MLHLFCFRTAPFRSSQISFFCEAQFLCFYPRVLFLATLFHLLSLKLNLDVLHLTMLRNLGTQEAIVCKYFPELKIIFIVQLFTNYAPEPHLSSRPGNYLLFKALK